MVATRLAAVGGSGKAYRCGGEEFAILFRETSARDAHSILDLLRKVVEGSSFRMRGTERRTAPRASEPDRRRPAHKKAGPTTIDAGDELLSVTVSIGVAEPSTRWRDPEQVIQAADAALYQAKRGGRNRVERAGATPQRAPRSRRLKAAK
jgi:PleD family two-component response regulator